MKILLANYRYFISGGPERYMFNVSEQLQENGHEIIPFSVKYTKNYNTPYANYFVEPAADRDAIYFTQQKMTVRAIYRTLSRLFYSSEVESAVTRLVNDTNPQIAYILHYLRKLSPSLLVGLKKKNIPIVVRLSDYSMFCPQAHCLYQNVPCTLCLNKHFLIDSVKKRCVKDNLTASLLNAIATWNHHRNKYFDLIDIFITTNKFMYDMMCKAGYPEEKLACIPTFTDINTFTPSDDYAKSDYIIYAGRLDYLKGVHILIKAFAGLRQTTAGKDIRLVIAGTGKKEYINMLTSIVVSEHLGDSVDFTGQVNSSKLASLLQKAFFSVVPSLWYENLPNALLESYACGTPVIASDIGMLPDSVMNQKTGLLFTPGDTDSLMEKMEYCLNNGALLHRMAIRARREARERYAPETHIASLTHIFSTIIDSHH